MPPSRVCEWVCTSTSSLRVTPCTSAWSLAVVGTDHRHTHRLVPASLRRPVPSDRNKHPLRMHEYLTKGLNSVEWEKIKKKAWEKEEKKYSVRGFPSPSEKENILPSTRKFPWLGEHRWLSLEAQRRREFGVSVLAMFVSLIVLFPCPSHSHFWFILLLYSTVYIHNYLMCRLIRALFNYYDVSDTVLFMNLFLFKHLFLFQAQL